MTVDPLASAWAKYHWASKHMKRVETAFERAFDQELDPFSMKTEIETFGDEASALIKIERLPVIRNDFGLALGDVVQNFRAALDHLAWGLVTFGHEPRPRRPQDVYFPMAKSGTDFDNRINSWLPGVPGEYRAIIRGYQPYRRGDGPKAIRWLNKLSNTDKHRVLVPTVVSQAEIKASVAVNWPISSWEWMIRKPGALNIGKPVLRLTLTRGIPADCKVKVNGEVSLYPSLGRGLSVEDFLASTRATVLEILSVFDELL